MSVPLTLGAIQAASRWASNANCAVRFAAVRANLFAAAATAEAHLLTDVHSADALRAISRAVKAARDATLAADAASRAYAAAYLEIAYPSHSDYFFSDIARHTAMRTSAFATNLAAYAAACSTAEEDSPVGSKCCSSKEATVVSHKAAFAVFTANFARFAAVEAVSDYSTSRRHTLAASLAARLPNPRDVVIKAVEEMAAAYIQADVSAVVPISTVIAHNLNFRSDRASEIIRAAEKRTEDDVRAAYATTLGITQNAYKAARAAAQLGVVRAAEASYVAYSAACRAAVAAKEVFNAAGNSFILSRAYKMNIHFDFWGTTKKEEEKALCSCSIV